MKASKRFFSLDVTARALTLGGLIAWTSVSQAYDLEPVKLEVTFAVTWAELVGTSEGLNNTSDSDTWVGVIDLRAANVVVFPGCEQLPCPARIDVSEVDNKGVNLRITSTSEIPADNLVIRAERRTSHDVFIFDSDRRNSGVEFFRFLDTEVGAYYPQDGTGSILWRLDRSFVSPSLPVGFVERDTAGFIAALRDPSVTYEVTEFFVNQVMQAAYTKTGTAKITQVRVLSEVAPSAALTCRYEVATDWGTGYVAFVHLKNETDEPVNGWQVAINFQDAISVTNSWSTLLSGASPAMSAVPVSWNQVIYPGQEINFGFQGIKISGQTSAASVTGSNCR
ncbi:MAG: cellulose binding domain-containing protein [Cellvibrionaceae bacterium]|nr:cellulose binding domain-containing protein [Cellvibrionaceae bacterium]